MVWSYSLNSTFKYYSISLGQKCFSEAFSPACLFEFASKCLGVKGNLRPLSFRASYGPWIHMESLHHILLWSLWCQGPYPLSDWRWLALLSLKADSMADISCSLFSPGQSLVVFLSHSASPQLALVGETPLSSKLDFPGIMLREISQSQKDKYFMIPLIWGI